MDNERRMIKLPLYYSMSRHDGTFPNGAHLLDSTWTSFMKRIDFDPWGFPLEDGTAMFLVDGEMVQMVDLRRQVSGLGLEVGLRCVDFMSCCDLSHWNIYGRFETSNYTVLYMKRTRTKRKTLCFLEHLWRINGFSFEVCFLEASWIECDINPGMWWCLGWSGLPVQMRRCSAGDVCWADVPRYIAVVSLGFVDQWIGSSLQCSSWRTTKATQLWQSLSHEPLILVEFGDFTKGSCNFVVGFQEVVRSFEVKQFFVWHCDTCVFPKAKIVCVPRVPSTFGHLVASPRNSNCLALIVNVAGTKKMQVPVVPVVLVLCVFDTKSWRPLTLQGKLCST